MLSTSQIIIICEKLNVIVDIKRFEKGYHEKCNKNVTFDKISRTFPQIETTSFLMLTLFRHHYFFARISAYIYLALLICLNGPCA